MQGKIAKKNGTKFYEDPMNGVRVEIILKFIFKNASKIAYFALILVEKLIKWFGFNNDVNDKKINFISMFIHAKVNKDKLEATGFKGQCERQ